MANTAPKKERIPFNADVLRWARVWRGRSVDEVATRLKQPVEKIQEWEDKNSDTVPTVLQARSLANFYERPFLEFFLKSIPPVKEPELVPDFRRPRDAKKLNPEQARDLKSILSWAEAHRINALDLYSEIGENAPNLPDEIYATIAQDADAVAGRVRGILNFDISEQTSIKSSEKHTLPSVIRNKFEAAGILTFKQSGLKELGVRGICIYANPLPVVIFGNESPAAQAFTLAHELGHVVLRESGIIGKVGKKSSETEKWCDQFAASFLMPRQKVRDVAGPMPNAPADEVADDDLASFANTFRVSRHAMLIRLVHLGYVDPAFYWSRKKAQFDSEEAKFKQFGRAEYYGTRFINTVGNLYTALVMEAWSSGRLTNHNAAEYMGIKNLAHLHDIREHFGKT
jgi:Zn-dependent peptidase ImmA (M78 family)